MNKLFKKKNNHHKVEEDTNGHDSSDTEHKVNRITPDFHFLLWNMLLYIPAVYALILHCLTIRK